MGEACRVLGTPVVSGNVSFYNETLGEGAIPPTPTIGMVGLLKSVDSHVAAGFSGEGDAIVLFGQSFEELGASEYLSVIHGLEAGLPPKLDLEVEKGLQALLVEAARRGVLRSAHDLSEGGFAVGLAECAIFSGIGAEVRLELKGLRPDAVLFGESASRAIVSCAKSDEADLLALAGTHGVPCTRIGSTGGARIRIEPGIDIALDEAQHVWSRTLPEALG